MFDKIKYKVGKWLPSDQAFLNKWLGKVAEEAANSDQKLAPSVQMLQDLIESDPLLKEKFNDMFTEIPNKPKYQQDAFSEPTVKNYQQMLKMINHVMNQAPEFNTTGLVGFPINAILDWAMGTKAGYEVFLDHRVNDCFRDILDAWGEFLSSEKSAYVLNTGENGWLSPVALKEMSEAAYGTNFLDIFNTPNQDINNGFGFKSWDEFFTRTFKEGVRPVASPEDDSIIANACESAPYRTVTNVNKTDKYWIKGQPYSLQDILNKDDLTDKFVGGTIYQAFLSALSYHRWHAPISGTIVKAYNVYGTYYSENYYEGFGEGNDADPSAPNDSQAYITEVASRAIIVIEADNKDLGLLTFVAVGMAEVSSNEITVKVGQHVNKGDQIGMFHFGGSTHLLIFQPDVNVEFDLHGQTASLDSNNIPLSSKIAKVSKKA